MRKKILITGSSGFIGSHFVQKNKTKYDLITPNHKELDILDRNSLISIWESFKPDVVINFAAHRDANSAELQRDDKQGSAWQTNVEGVKNIAHACNLTGSFFIHISTDMVFSGSKNNPGPYKESDTPEKNPSLVSWYGFTKAEGERVLGGVKNTAIVRIGNVTNPVYDPTLDYVGKILYLYDKQKLYPLFDNQYLSLTWIPIFFDVIDSIILTKKTGVFHATSKNVFTPYELGEYVIAQKRKNITPIQKISIDTFLATSPNRYPKYGGLVGEKTTKILETRLVTWQKIVDDFTL